MITYLTHLRVEPHNAPAFEAAMAEMSALVAAHEPGVALYQCARACATPDSYVVIEVYRDEAAFTAHWQTDYLRPIQARTTALIVPGSLETRRYLAC